MGFLTLFATRAGVSRFAAFFIIFFAIFGSFLGKLSLDLPTLFPLAIINFPFAFDLLSLPMIANISFCPTPSPSPLDD